MTKMWRDVGYVRRREAMVGIAEAEADVRCPPPPDDAPLDARDKWARRWNAEFHRAVDRLMNDPFVQARMRAA